MLSFALASCAGPTVTTAADLPGWQDDAFASFVRAPSEEAAHAWLAATYRPVPLPTLLFTGYFEVTVPGARSPGPGFPVPLLRPPRGGTGLDRAAIMAGALAGQGLELAWLRSQADLFFLQLQGSGQVALAEGGVLRVGSAGSNGRAPVPTASLFGGAAPDLSISGLRAWAASAPARATTLIARDPSYVFFREMPAGPGDSHGRPLVPLRSLAVDPAVIPLGSLMWIDVAGDARRFRRLMVAQDTGVHGASADVFFGVGPAAEQEGGRLHSSGRAWMLAPA